MKLSTQSHSLIKSALKEAIHKLANEGHPQVTDIHFLPNREAGELFIFNDDDVLLAKACVKEWTDDGTDNFNEGVIRLLRTELGHLRESGALDELPLLKPYSFVLVDDDRETVAELLLIDDDTLLASDDLLKGLDAELDDFLKNLLGE